MRRGAKTVERGVEAIKRTSRSLRVATADLLGLLKKEQLSAARAASAAARKRLREADPVRGMRKSEAKVLPRPDRAWLQYIAVLRRNVTEAVEEYGVPKWALYEALGASQYQIKADVDRFERHLQFAEHGERVVVLSTECVESINKIRRAMRNRVHLLMPPADGTAGPDLQQVDPVHIIDMALRYFVTHALVPMPAAPAEEPASKEPSP